MTNGFENPFLLIGTMMLFMVIIKVLLTNLNKNDRKRRKHHGYISSEVCKSKVQSKENRG